MRVKKIGILDEKRNLLVGGETGTFADVIISYRDSGGETVMIGLPLVIGEGLTSS